MYRLGWQKIRRCSYAVDNGPLTVPLWPFNELVVIGDYGKTIKYFILPEKGSQRSITVAGVVKSRNIDIDSIAAVLFKFDPNMDFTNPCYNLRGQILIMLRPHEGW